MKTDKSPFVSVIILNYYGEKVIENVITSLQNLNYPKDGYEIIVVDNNSRDKSPEILKTLSEKYSNIRLIPLDKNLGFSKGNNVGIKESKGEYVALLNNDCVVSRDWLKSLVNTALSNQKVFAVASKILLYPKYLKFDLKINPAIAPIYSWLLESTLYKLNSKKIYLNLVQKDGLFKTEIPFDSVNDEFIVVEFVFNSKKKQLPKDLKSLVTLTTPGAEIIDCIKNQDEISYKVKINLAQKTIQKNTFSKIQNAGIIPFQDGYARDIGAVIRYSVSYYEHDEGQYDIETEVYAFCGAAVLLSKPILDKIGYLDESFFMYYEDVELSERARLNGYKIYYSPRAEVRHIHALSSKEGSGFFVYNVEKGRLLHVFYNFPKLVFLQQYLKIIIVIMYGVANTIMNIQHFKAVSREKGFGKPSSQKTQLVKVAFFFFFHYFYLLYLRTLKKRNSSKSVIENYQQILDGRWYFKS